MPSFFAYILYYGKLERVYLQMLSRFDSKGKKGGPGKSKDAEAVLRLLGAEAGLIGFAYLNYMLERTGEEPELLLLPAKYLYPEAAAHFNVSTRAMGRNTENFVIRCWSRAEAESWEKITGRPKLPAPTVEEFLKLLSAYLNRPRPENSRGEGDGPDISGRY